MLTDKPFFTLSELQEAWNVVDRQNLRDNTVGKGAPHAVVGRETVFITADFVEWLRSRKQGGSE